MIEEDQLQEYSEEEFLPVSALAEFSYCERRAALHLLEGIWEDNMYTAEGTRLHERVDQGLSSSNQNIRIARGLRIHSRHLGLSGKTDVVEFHRTPSGEKGVHLPDVEGFWQPYPIEYKRGRLKHEVSFEIQLCAQALCLEEMLDCAIPSGAIFYGKSRRRKEIVFVDVLQKQTAQTALQLHNMVCSGRTPPAKYSPKCDKCSLFDFCNPKTIRPSHSARRYLAKALDFDEEGD